MLATAIVFGQALRKFRQPAVVGEMIGGIVLGPTIFGLVAPGLYEWLFASSAGVAVVRHATIKVGMLFFLFFAGLEVDLDDLKIVGRKAVLIGLVGTLLPIAAGVGLVYLVPREFWGTAVQKHLLSFALFVGMNLANSANPVIARVLMDLGLLNGPIGTLIMTATIVDDLVNWSLFAVILSDIAPSGSAQGDRLSYSVALTMMFFGILVVGGRWLGPRLLRLARKYLAWPNGFITVTCLMVLLAATASEALGLHAFLGAFLLGAVLGRNHADRDHKAAHDAIGSFVLSFFAPIYFISMGMTTNFLTHFDPWLTTVVLCAACISKVTSVLIGAGLAGMPLDREAWAIAFGLNARGATGIILAGVGLANQVIDERIFVSVVLMAITTSLMAGPMMTHLLRHRIDVKAPEKIA